LPQIIPITDPADPRIAPYRQVRERDLVGRRGEFIAEGEVVLNVLLGAESRCRASSLLIAEKRIERLAPLIERLPAEVPVYAAGQAVMDAIVGFHIHRGILAIGRRAAARSVQEVLAALPERAVVLALFGIGNHDNMGGLFRNAAAFGAGAVLLGADCCDPMYRKAIRVSVGAALTTPFAWFEPGEDPIALLRASRFEPLALSPSGSEALGSLKPPARAAVILGAEGPGLPAAMLARARTISIPMAGGFDSLNVAVTSGIVLHHLTSG
jgi:tRNA G18 (ribose-2'-O)-methylase SpoU